MVDWLVNILQTYPELAVFLAIGIGFLVGPIKVMGFSLGSVTGTLLAAVVIGQAQISIDSAVKSTFFILFISDHLAIEVWISDLIYKGR